MIKETILQIGWQNWAEIYDIPSNLNWVYCSPDQVGGLITSRRAAIEYNSKLNQLLELEGQPRVEQACSAELARQKETVLDYRLLLITDDFHSDYFGDLLDFVEAYEVFYPRWLSLSSVSLKTFLSQKMAQCFEESTEDFLQTLSKISFKKSYGAKLPLRDFLLAPGMKKHQITYQGNSRLSLAGDFGLDYQLLGHFSYNVVYDSSYSLDFWQEFQASSACDVMVKVALLAEGADGRIVKEWQLSDEKLKEQYHIDSNQNGYLAISIWLRGQGQLALGPLHYRFSRKGYGEFLFGGQRYVDQTGEEFHYYFNPGDLKPPLMVYFSGWRTAEGFEGFPMMKRLKAPFLLICDPRLEGGSFYLGSESFEENVRTVISSSLDYLCFDAQRDLILSGLSMGTFGAMYYASFLKPHALVLGKPLTNLGSIAERERLERPTGFPTSLDLLAKFGGNLNQEAVNQLNQKFWRLFEQADLSKTRIYATYMTDDDYDQTAINDLLAAVEKNQAKLVVRAWTGRHNDSSKEVATWFQGQYAQLLKEDFSRKD